MRTVKVTLGGTTHTVQELRSRENAAWRQELESHFEDLAQLLDDAPGLDLTDGQALAGLVRSVSGKLLRSVDVIRELVLAYAPDLEGALDEAYDSEMLDAFTKILGLAYPFGSVLESLLKVAELGSPGA